MAKIGSSDFEDLDIYRTKLLIIGIVGVMQPISKEDIKKNISNKINPRLIKKSMDILVKENMLKTMDGIDYWLSYKARRDIFSGKLSKKRDISRMLFLIEKSKGGGGVA